MSTVRGCPPRGLCLAGGISGATMVHCSSVRSEGYCFRAWSFFFIRAHSSAGGMVNIRLTHPAFQNTTVFFGAIWYNIPHEIDPVTRDLYFRLCAGQCDEHYPLLPTNGGADEAGLYRTQVGSELLASPTCSACGA